MGRLRKQQSKRVDNKCLVCGTVVLGSMGKLKSHIIRRHSTMSNPKRCYHCGQKGHGQINIGHKQAKSECTSITIDEEGLHKVRKYLEFTKARWIALTKDFDDQRWEREIQDRFNIGNITLRCDVCEIDAFQSGQGLFSHVERVHGPQMQYLCSENNCRTLTFLSLSDLQKHAREHHINMYPHICEDCGKAFKNANQRIHHKGIVHSNRNTKKKPVDRTARMWKDFKEECRCDIDFSNTKRKKVLRHFKEIHLGYEKCPMCKLLLRNPSLHSCKTGEKKPRKIYQCEECDVVLKDLQPLKDHVQRVHRPETMIQCNLCSKYLTDGQREKHSHSPREKTKCPMCDKEVSKLKIHIETVHKDDNDKRYQCEQCNKGFFDKNRLDAHIMNVHLKLRPWKCRKGCDQAYNDRSNMIQHEKRLHR